MIENESDDGVEPRCPSNLSLMAQDGEAMRFCRFTVPSADIYPLTLRFEGHLGSTPSSLSFSIIGKSSAFGVYSQSLNLYDWTKGLFEPNTNSTALLSKTYGRMDCFPWSEAWRYVRPSDKKVMALVRVKVIGVEASAGWPADYDRAWFTYEPGV